MDTDRNGLEKLDRNTCWSLLATRRLGRIGVTISGLPAILPVYYAVDNGSVVFLSAESSKLHAIGRGDVICFEVDAADDLTGSGWSVLIQGRAHEIIDPQARARAAALGVDEWAPQRADRYVRLVASLMSGRRVVGTTSPRDSHHVGAALA